MLVNRQRLMLAGKTLRLIESIEAQQTLAESASLYNSLNNSKMSHFLFEGDDAGAADFRDRMKSLAASGDDLQASAQEASAEIDGMVSALQAAGGFEHTIGILNTAKADIADVGLGDKWGSFKSSVSDFEGIGKVWDSVKDPLKRLAGSLAELEALKSSVVNSIAKTAGYLGNIGLSDDSFDTPIAVFSGTDIESSDIKDTSGEPVDVKKLQKLYSSLAKSVKPSEEFGSAWSKMKNAFSFMKKGSTGAFGLDGAQFAAELLSISANKLMDLSDAISSAAPEEGSGEGTPAGEAQDVLAGASALQGAIEDPPAGVASALGTGAGGAPAPAEEKTDEPEPDPEDPEEDPDKPADSGDLSRDNFVSTLKPLMRSAGVTRPNKFARALADELGISESVEDAFDNLLVEGYASLSLLLEASKEIEYTRVKELAVEYGVSEEEAAEVLSQLTNVLDDEFDIQVTGAPDSGTPDADTDDPGEPEELPPEVVDVVDDVAADVPELGPQLEELPPDDAEVVGDAIVDVQAAAAEIAENPPSSDDPDENEKDTLARMKDAVAAAKDSIEKAKATKDNAMELWDEYGSMVTDVWNFFSDNKGDKKDKDEKDADKKPTDEWVKRGKKAGIEWDGKIALKSFKQKVRRAEKKAGGAPADDAAPDKKDDKKPEEKKEKKKRVKRSPGDVWKLDEPKSRGRQWAAKGKGGKAKNTSYFKTKDGAEKYALRTEATRFLRQFGFTRSQLERATDRQLIETYHAYGGDGYFLNESTQRLDESSAPKSYDEDELVMYRWRKMANLDN